MEETQIDTNEIVAMSTEELVEAVKNQVEYYFSKENLQSDAFLTSQMDAQMTVPIAVVMKFAKLKALTQDEAILRKALESSTITQVVDDRIKANIKPAGRNTIILREIPTDTPEAEVREIFNYEGCKPIASIRSDIGDSWFVQMDSEEDAKDTLLDLRLKKRTFNGQSLKARLKTETVIRSFYPLQATPVIPVGFTPMGFPAQGMDMRQFGYALPEGVMPLPVMMGDVGVVDASGALADPTKPESEHGQNNSKSAGAGNRDGRKSNQQQQSGTGRGANNKKTEGNNGGRSKGGNNNAAGHVKAPVIEINSSNFPPLNSEDTPVPTPGYKGPYQKYNFEEIIAIVKEVKEATLPVALNPVNHPLAMTATVNMDLLKKQRTYSIDETREQLRQGRPVHREAVTAGAVDYRSLMYGDENQQQQQPVAVTATTAQPAVVAPPAATPKSATKARSSSQSSVGDSQTPKKISASSWAAMVKTSAAATAATDSATPARPVRQQTAKPATPAASDIKKTAVTPAKGGERKRSSSKGGEAKDGKAIKEGRDRKKNNTASSAVAAKETGTKKEDCATAATVTAAPETVTASSSDSSPALQTEGATATTSTPWGGKTSFAQIVKLTTPEDGEVSPASNSSPVKTADTAKRPATAGGRQQGTVAKSVSGSRTAASGSRPTGSNNGERKSRPVGDKKDRAVTSTGGADAGVWVREALPALDKK